MSHAKILSELGLSDDVISGGVLKVRTPVDGSEIASIAETDPAAMSDIIANSKRAFAQWRQVPGPRRGELARLLGEELRAAKEPLGRLVALECGKIYQEGLGEVQEMIDICDFAVGLSRQLYGLTIASERPGHKMMESWHPLGVVGVISAFNFPVAVWSWNTRWCAAMPLFGNRRKKPRSPPLPARTFCKRRWIGLVTRPKACIRL